MVVNEKEGIKGERDGKREGTEVGRKKELKKLEGRCRSEKGRCRREEGRCRGRKEGAVGRKKGAGKRKEGAGKRKECAGGRKEGAGGRKEGAEGRKEVAGRWGGREVGMGVGSKDGRRAGRGTRCG